MAKKITVGGRTVTLTDNQYLAAGGEGEIYVNGGMAYKLYHDPNKKMLPLQKISELSGIRDAQVIIPKDILYDDKSGSPVGYTTNFVADAEALVKLFTRTFKDDNSITPLMIVELVKKMQSVTTAVHAAKCLIVDYNELNVLFQLTSTGGILPFYIDTDSYATPSFHATAVMDSIRDRTASYLDKANSLHYKPTEATDWFSWSILAFCLYTNIHPFRGNHPKYKPKDKAKQMDDGVSVFHPGVRVPPTVNNFNVIPPRHLDWFKQVFLKGERGVPPLADGIAPSTVPTQIVTIKGTDKLDVSELAAYSSPIVAIQYINGIFYVATKTHLYANGKEIGTHTARKIHIGAAPDGTPVFGQQDGSNKIAFRVLTNGASVGTAIGTDMFVRNGAFYTMGHGKLTEHTFRSFGGKIIHIPSEIENVSTTSAKMYEGCVIQDLLGKKFLTLPYKQGNCFSRHIPQLDGYRIIGAKADKNVVVILGEKQGQYDRHVVVYKKDYSDFTYRKTEDVTYGPINFAVMESGLCILLSDTTEIELFATATQVETLKNPPFDETMPLFATPNGIFFINNNSLHQLKKK
jgi:hypothetical protein